MPGGIQRRRTAHPDVGAHRLQQDQVRPQHAAVQQVADDRDLEAGQPALVLADRERVEQRLRRVLVHAVAGVDDRRMARPGEQVRRARRGVAHHDHVRRHRLEVAHGVEERLPLRHARRRGRDAQRVGAQTLLGDLERRARARARLEEQIHDGAAAQRGHLLDRSAADFLHRDGGVEDERDLVGREALDPEQVPRAQLRGGRRLRTSGRLCSIGCLGRHASPSIRISSTPSISCSRTCTLCFSDVGTFLPT